MKVDKKTNEIIITLSSNVDSSGLKRLINYAKYLEISSQLKSKQADADALADAANESWWKKNKRIKYS